MLSPSNTPASTSIRHPLGSKARILLCSVFGPYAQDDEYGSRRMNPMELYHNQVTRAQGPFSLRMFHRSWGLMLIQVNLRAATVLLDFPTLERFIQELRDNRYDVIGIGSIPLNILKVRRWSTTTAESDVPVAWSQATRSACSTRFARAL